MCPTGCKKGSPHEVEKTNGGGCHTLTDAKAKKRVDTT
jgi:hypothetical protein